MGGGDLNSKKSWHPNTMKNQERVWKAEQAAAEEKKRILELQHERGEERDTAELNDMVKRNFGMTSEDRLHWMYDKPDKKVHQEDYLLGKAIDKGCDQSDKPEPDAIPAVARRVVGSSMLTTGGDSQVDIARKIREDPLLLIKERERAARAALLNNPLQRRRLTELLRKEQEQKKESKTKKNEIKKIKDLDNILAAKLNALGGNKAIDLAALLDSENSSSEEEKLKKKKKKRKQEKVKKKSKKSKKKTRHSTETDVESSDDKRKKGGPSKERHDTDLSLEKIQSSHKAEFRKRRSNSVCDDANTETEAKRSRKDSTSSKQRSSRSEPEFGRIQPRDSTEESRVKGLPRRKSPQRDKNGSQHERRVGLNEEERAARLAAMAAAGAEREVERGRRVAHQRAADEAADSSARAPRRPGRSEARALPDSLEDRIHSNRHYIQRDQRHMSEHFARR